MKKTILLLWCLLILLHASVFATDSRYVDIVKGDATVAQFDKETLQYEKDPYLDEQLLSVWIKTFTNNGSYNLNHYYFHLKEQKMMLLSSVEYNANRLIQNKFEYKYNPDSWSPVLPDTAPEAWYSSTMKFAKDNNNKLQTDYNKRMKLDEKNKRNMFSIFNDAFNAASGGIF